MPRSRTRSRSKPRKVSRKLQEKLGGKGKENARVLNQVPHVEDVRFHTKSVPSGFIGLSGRG